jgi:hypothetical protein
VPDVIVNFMTAVHASSTGTTIAFPDVCKTPAPPAPSPIPIPYPNVGMSSDASKEAKKVKMEGAKVMVKTSVFRMSSGDEAGVAQGLVSSKIKGKCEFANYSFDVKAGGKNVCRLADPMKQNQGSSPNAFGPAELQAPNVGLGAQAEACKRVNEEKKKQGSNPDTSWGKSGVIGRDRPAFQKVADNFKVVIYIRSTNPACGRWIAAKHRPKPHAVIDGKTIDGANQDLVRMWMAKARRRKRDGQKLSSEARTALAQLQANRVPAGRSYSYAYFHGIVMWRKDGDPDDGMPLRARARKYGGLKSDVGCNYKGKWITGDYDLMDIMYNANGCERPDQNAASFGRIKKELNGGMGWDGIQHGPQAQWVEKDINMPAEISKWLASDDPNPPSVKIAASRSLPACDNDLTVVYPGGAVHLAENQNAKDALECMGCKEPKETRK